MIFNFGQAQSRVEQYKKFEASFTSDRVYENPLYDLEHFKVTFTSESGREKTVHGFWDGNKTWKVRFLADELGNWTFRTSCSDEQNKGLNNQTGSFECFTNQSPLSIYQKGPIQHIDGTYHLSYADGSPFFWVACTAWNGALKSTNDEWDTYLQHRVDHHYNIIQFVTTQWRGGDQNSKGEVAFTGAGKISLNVSFFEHLDQKIDRINDYGLVAAPVLLWALPFGQGRELSPGYYLADNEAIKLARYLVARYGGNQVIWVLGGDGKYTDELEDRWKYIGEQVFGSGEYQGLATTHPMGSSWYGDIYMDVDWIDIIGYQSSHSNGERVVNWVNKGPMANQWDKVPPRPIINMEPNYEEIHFRITAEDVRNASYWSIFNTPPSGITYGANGIWPWIREGESILNHRHPPGTSTWRKSIDFPGSLQIGYLSEFMQSYPWWNLKPAPDKLAEQPGDQTFNHFISVVSNHDESLIMAYVPVQSEIKLYNPLRYEYQAQWFDPIKGSKEAAEISNQGGVITSTSPQKQDYVLILQKK